MTGSTQFPSDLALVELHALVISSPDSQGTVVDYDERIEAAIGLALETLVALAR